MESFGGGNELKIVSRDGFTCDGNANADKQSSQFCNQGQSDPKSMISRENFSGAVKFTCNQDLSDWLGDSQTNQRKKTLDALLI